MSAGPGVAGGPDSAEVVLAGLDPEQRAVATALHGPVVVLAGAGTGKTRAITHRIAYAVRTGAHDPRRSLAVTFTARAAGEMRERLRALGASGVQARTFHAAALRQLRYFWPRAVGGPFPELMASKARLVAEAASRTRVATDPATVRDLAAEIEWAKVSQCLPEAYPAAAGRAGRDGPAGVSPELVGRVYATYDELRSARGRLDFEDVLLLTVGILQSRPDIADEVRAQYRWFTVDEYQDVNPLQQRLLELWCGEHPDVCVVGDAAQTIYTFTGATPAYLLDFRSRHPDATEVRLVRSYRCSPQVVTLANKVLGSASGPTARLRLQLISQQPPAAEPTVTSYDDETAEAEGVASSVAALVAGGTAPRDIAVLFRVNAQSEVFEAALADAGVPCVVRGAERFFERPEVREAVTRIRGQARATPAGGGGGVVEDVVAVLAAMGWDPAPPRGTGATRERWESLAALVTLAGDLVAAGTADDLPGLVDELDRRAEVQHAPVHDGVTLASLHSAKGLEWEAVFIVGAVEGMLPIVHADTPERVEEERRLFYVGVTRARSGLHVSWARARQPGGRQGRHRSRFLDDALGAEPIRGGHGALVRPGRGTARAERRRRGPAPCRVCGKALVTGQERALGRCVTCESPYDEDLLARLKDWRLQEARRRAVPAYVVFTDATLLAVAETRPAGAADLAAITGVGPGKQQRYGDCLLALVAGEPVPEPADPDAAG
ncbi:MAG: ATP-dependent DNA helicase UvrD2 [Actinomycetota bacterium]|nr:MAG: ATP-dependent DNA helicase UvrD2 [Actinomycetota bacterium]